MPDQELERKLEEMGTRYLKRTLGELTRLGELLVHLRAGEQSALKEIEQLAHKIFGSGAMFGFDKVSTSARELELAAQDTQAADLLDRLSACIAALEKEAHDAARARGLE
jgi:HPt (histidine-containing phosphotransfer) domain-containing protein